jgi:hypothetical protein
MDVACGASARAASIRTTTASSCAVGLTALYGGVVHTYITHIEEPQLAQAFGSAYYRYRAARHAILDGRAAVVMDKRTCLRRRRTHRQTIMSNGP